MKPNCSAMFGGGPAAACGVPAWRTPITRMRSAPRWIAGASGVDWRSAPSLKCAPAIATGGNRNGTAELAIRWSRPIFDGTPRRPARSQAFEGPRGLDECRRYSPRERGGADRKRVGPARGDGLAQAPEIDVAGEQPAQRRVVEQRARHGQQPAARGQREDEVQPRSQHVERAGAEHLADAESAPDPRKLGGATAEVVRVGAEDRGIDRARRGPAEDLERQDRTRRVPARDRLDHADLPGGACPAAGQHQCDARLRSHGAGHARNPFGQCVVIG